ncbi:hypothetical protein DEO72_LG10g1839 [Vigna unguiculata]|uniref:Uncharacterized protein n=1 Tax=Vigna unguiculata TaxID=3917 RepID=A0A4D6NBB6_VIGUN|nr:hypothetical protein DEO72_LG10g1839 [Vigna unguiculata]
MAAADAANLVGHRNSVRSSNERINTTTPLRSRSSETSTFISFPPATIHVLAPPLQICICEQQHQHRSEPSLQRASSHTGKRC